MAAIVQLLLAIIINWLIWSTVINFLAGKRLVAGPVPLVSRFLCACWAGFWRACWRHGFKTQYDRRGFLHATSHVLIVLSSFATLGALINPEVDMWGAVARWWAVTLAYWFLLKQWQRLKQQKRRLPRRRQLRNAHRHGR